MSAILKLDFQKREQLRFSEVNYLDYTKKNPILHVATTFSLKQGETRTSHGPIPHPLNQYFSQTSSHEIVRRNVKLTRENLNLDIKSNTLAQSIKKDIEKLCRRQQS